MPSMTCVAACSTPSAVSPALLFLTTLFFAHVHPSPAPIQLQRRQSFFRCTGWGAGCSNLDYSFQPATYSRPEPRRYEKPVQVVRSRVRPSWWGWSRGSRNGYGLHFLFTSGTSGSRRPGLVGLSRELSFLRNVSVLWSFFAGAVGEWGRWREGEFVTHGDVVRSLADPTDTFRQQVR